MGFLDAFQIGRDKDRFARWLIDQLEASGVRGFTFDRQAFALRFEGGRVALLSNFHAEFLRAPLWRRAAVLDAIIPLLREAPAEIPSDFIKARRALMPAIRDPMLFEVTRLRALAEGGQPLNVAQRPLGDDHVITLVYDTEKMMSFIGEKTLADWDVPFERAYEYALENLGRSPPRFASPQRGLYASEWSDAYDASRLLLSDMIGGLALRGRPVAVAPHPNLLLVAGDEDPPALAALVARGEQETAKPRAINAVPLVLAEGAWQNFSPTGNDATALQIRKLVRQSRGASYAAQAQLLQKVHARTGKEIHVANYMGQTAKHTGELTTFCVWTRGIPSLLPRTDHIGLVDPERGEAAQLLGLFAWDDVVRASGALLKPVPGTPQRWEVDGFPDAAAIAQLVPIGQEPS